VELTCIYRGRNLGASSLVKVAHDIQSDGIYFGDEIENDQKNELNQGDHSNNQEGSLFNHRRLSIVRRHLDYNAKQSISATLGESNYFATTTMPTIEAISKGGRYIVFGQPFTIFVVLSENLKSTSTLVLQLANSENNAKIENL